MTLEEGLRESVIRCAREYLGQTRSDSARFWLDVCPECTEANVKQFADRLSWCGAFALFVLRQRGLTSWTWRLGKGFIYSVGGAPRLPITTLPLPGDIAYFDRPFQHYALVTAVESDGVHVIAGNTPNVSESVAHGSPVFYSIRPLINETGRI